MHHLPRPDFPKRRRIARADRAGRGNDRPHGRQIAAVAALDLGRSQLQMLVQNQTGRCQQTFGQICRHFGLIGQKQIAFAVVNANWTGDHQPVRGLVIGDGCGSQPLALEKHFDMACCSQGRPRLDGNAVRHQRRPILRCGQVDACQQHHKTCDQQAAHQPSSRCNNRPKASIVAAIGGVHAAR